ncbi:LysR substrate-binding domain-containing protein [Cupriavidus sp. DL-D2]|uniref:LysR substrate-binding domain-containing protein n=1 Tax=Cupriavidus sp. DL-D2 TaxID=3144974 RepID=UPI0032129703
MQLKWIDDLLVLERTRSFSRAAELRYVTQSALSRRIRALEDWAGAQLVDRNTYPLALTPAGATFCETARQAADLLTEARATLHRESTLPDRTLDIVAGHTLSLAFLPDWLTRCRQRFGSFHARVSAANVIDAVVALAEGQCDLMLGYHHPRVPVSLDADRFLSLSVGSDTLIPVSVPTSRGRPLYPVPDPADLADAHGTPFLAYSPNTTLGRVVGSVLDARDAHRGLIRCYESDMAMLLLKMAVEGHGLAWLPLSTAAEALSDGALVHAGDASWQASLEIRAYRPAASANATLLELWRMLAAPEQMDAAMAKMAKTADSAAPIGCFA